MTDLDDLCHEIRNSVQCAKDALRMCYKHDCPLGLGQMAVQSDLKHYLNRIERALNDYISSEKLGSIERASNSD